MDALDGFESDLSIEDLDKEVDVIKKDASLISEINKLRQNSAILLGDKEKRRTMLQVGISVDRFMPDQCQVVEKIAARRKTVSLTRNQTVDLGKLLLDKMERSLSKE